MIVLSCKSAAKDIAGAAVEAAFCAPGVLIALGWGFWFSVCAVPWCYLSWGCKSR